MTPPVRMIRPSAPTTSRRRVAESIAHQLCSTVEKPRYIVVAIGDALPRPRPSGATWVTSVNRLGSALAAANDATAIVFCEISSEADAHRIFSCFMGLPS